MISTGMTTGWRWWRWQRSMLVVLVAVVACAYGRGILPAWADAAATTAPLAPPLTLQLALEAALKDNPALQASGHQADAAHYRISQAAALDDPMIGADVEGIRSGTYMNVEYMASQAIPFPGKRRLRGRIAATAAEVAVAERDAVERELIAHTKTAYFTLYLMERSLDINRHNRDLLERAERVAESKYAVGTKSMQDVLKAQVELAKLSNERIVLQQQRTTAIARLNALMNRPPATPIVITTAAQLRPLALMLDELERATLANRPELRAAQREIERMADELKLARLDFWPDFTTRIEARQFRDGGGIREVDTMLAVNVPIWLWGKQRARMKEVAASAKAAAATLMQMQNEALAELRDAYARVEAARTSAELYMASILPQAEQSLNITQAGYEAERADFLDLLDAERSWKEHQLEHAHALVAFETAWADLERAVGQSLEPRPAGSASATEAINP